MASFDAPQVGGRASVGIDGKMVDAPVAERARRILARMTAIEAKQARAHTAFAALGEIPPEGALLYA
jgi:hypothetical protein